jgi:hypothetical protein
MHTERRLQQDLRATIQGYLDRGWEIITRAPLVLARGRMRLEQLPNGALTTSREES